MTATQCAGERGTCSRKAHRGLVRHVRPSPWIPAEWQWTLILDAARVLPLRERLMFCLAYDAALRREELVLLDVDDFDRAYRLIRLRAETTKLLRSREVAHGATSATLLVTYLQERLYDRWAVAWPDLDFESEVASPPSASITATSTATRPGS